MCILQDYERVSQRSPNELEKVNVQRARIYRHYSGRRQNKSKNIIKLLRINWKWQRNILEFSVAKIPKRPIFTKRGVLNQLVSTYDPSRLYESINNQRQYLLSRLIQNKIRWD